LGRVAFKFEPFMMTKRRHGLARSGVLRIRSIFPTQDPRRTAFKRQVPLGERYITDFFAPSVRLAVEVDGGVHRETRTADRRRDERLRRLGYRVVRVETAPILRDPERALELIRAALRLASPRGPINKRKKADPARGSAFSASH